MAKRSQKPIDKPFLITVLILSVAGFFIFLSASMGLLARDGASFSSVIFNQTILGLCGGFVGLIFTSKIHYRYWRKYALYLFILSLVINLLVFVPGIGFSHGGAQRWINLRFISIQPAEFLKIAFVIYLSAWFSGVRKKVNTFKQGLLPFCILLGITGIVLYLQHDTGTLAIIFISGMAIFIVAGGRIWHACSIFLAGVAGLGILALIRPYVLGRILTFINPARDPLGAGYQIQQSLIAIGSGGWFGRGFGQSIQKFNYLPEPIGDSIFAVMSEEFGFIGASILIVLFVFFTLRGLRIARYAPDFFSQLLAIGIIILIAVQSFMNIGAMLSVLPLSGMPLLFVSHGGTALFMTLAEVGIILNISKYTKK